jgi:hypothetical protein
MILSPSIVGSGEHSKGTLRLTVPAPPAGVTVALSSSEAKVAAVPASVTIPADGMAADFTVTAGNVGSVTPVTISAGYGSMTKAASLEIHPANPAISSVTIPVRSIAGGSTVTATVKIANPSSSNETTITLMGLPPGVVLVPSSVTIPAGGSEATFQVRTASVKTSTRATIGAVYLGLTKTVSLTVTPSGK